ncbi:ribose-phosphate pyrophosphokinase [Alteribacter lacisalsi]|uniref:Putative ribose-phosphate pyrophosphokinase n=1 Tax=Alteribacter lacisalsi TaxID=2045244 RepID=A0A2W0H6Q3_9BACI|nr:ribose-phosphate pyrophosphokinase [Alteribacter lacisalsi]PYZ97534.1 ribose-phosphate pyrophosphokinase [Alteribacter lacisalsi]
MTTSNMKVFSLNSNEQIAREVVRHLGAEMGKSTIKRFSDGEIQMNIEESIRGDDVYLIQSTSTPGNEYLMELLIMVDAMKRASAKSISCVIPYFGYSRQDRKARSREPITAKLIANLIEKAGADRIITVDIHAPQVQGFFNIPVDHLNSIPMLADYFVGKNLQDVVVVAPENGGVVRARQIGDILDAPIALIDRNRRETSGMDFIGEVEGKTAIIIDDMIDTARTITTASKHLIERGAKEVYACATHPVLSDPAMDRISESDIVEVVTTDSIYLPDVKQTDKITVLSLAPLLAQAIEKVQNNESVSTLFE